MRIVSDELKLLLNRAKHGFDFADLTPEFIEGAVVLSARQGRLMAVGRLEGQVLTVVLTPLGREALSIISTRPASRKERSL